MVLDDGSHIMEDITASFRYLYPRTAPGGIYAVEDLHSAYWEESGGGVGREGRFIGLYEPLIDELNADHARHQVAVTDFTKTTLSMYFYDSVVIFERGSHIKKQPQFIGMSFKKFWNNAIPKSWQT